MRRSSTTNLRPAMSATDVKVDMPPCEDVKNVTISQERRARVRKVVKSASTSSRLAINRLANEAGGCLRVVDAPKPAAEREEYVFPADRFFKYVGEKVPALKPLAKINGTMPDFATYCAQGPWPLRLADAMLRGTSQVVIVNNSLAGALIFIALWIPSSDNEAAWSSHAYVALFVSPARRRSRCWSADANRAVRPLRLQRHPRWPRARHLSGGWMGPRWPSYHDRLANPRRAEHAAAVRARQPARSDLQDAAVHARLQLHDDLVHPRRRLQVWLLPRAGVSRARHPDHDPP